MAGTPVEVPVELTVEMSVEVPVLAKFLTKEFFHTTCESDVPGKKWKSALRQQKPSIEFSFDSKGAIIREKNKVEQTNKRTRVQINKQRN